MAIVIEANYSKKLGLPEYSSHQYSITVRTEVTDLGKLEEESNRLYGLLQRCVDRSLQDAGFVPHGNGNGHNAGNGNGNGHIEAWNCTVKQRDLITRMVEERKLDKAEVENTAQQLFGKGVKALNRLEASGLIEELMRSSGGYKGNGQRGRYRPAGART